MDDATKKQKQLAKLWFLMKANTECRMADLKDAVWNVLHDHPGCGLTAWKDCLLIEYPTEVLDALSGDEKAVYEALDKLWQERYTDKLTGIEKSFADWADFFSSREAADTYDRLVQNG